ncbi:hypothetical protein VTI74DRAFT_8098 [Chaetomium olivicolor]
MRRALPAELPGLRARRCKDVSRLAATPSGPWIMPVVQRVTHLQPSRQCSSELPPQLTCTRYYATLARGGPNGHTRQLLDVEEWSLLQHVLNSPLEDRSDLWPRPLSAATETSLDASEESFSLAASLDASESGLPATDQQPAACGMDFANAFNHPLNRLAYLNKLSKEARKTQQLGDMSTSELAQLPTPSFSELLRSLDPVQSWGEEADPIDGIHVGPGMAQLTPLGQEIDKWGVRKRYVNLLAQAMNAVKLRREAGRYVPLSDYKVLLRCAGSSCDLEVLGEIWEMMGETGLRVLDPEANFELAKARFLTEPLYSQYDLARFRVRPINLHMKKIFILGIKARQYLKILGQNMIHRQRQMFGYNRHSHEHAEHLMRILRQDAPPYKLLKVATRLCYIVDERSLCAFMIALSRCGSLSLIQEGILKKYWGVQVGRRAGAEAYVAVQAIAYAPDSPLRPTERLLEAIVQSYCTNAEFTTALKVLDAVSNAYRIRISDKVWFNLLEWAYVLCSRPVSSEWKVLKRQFRGTKGVKSNAVQMIWDTMTAPPYNIRPGFDQYVLLAGSLISQGEVAKALDIMLELEPMYRQIQTKLEAVFCKHAGSSALGVDVAKTEMEWRRARARKHAAFYKLQRLCRGLLKKVCRGSGAEHITARGVPQFIEAFRDLLPANIAYPITTGTVEIDYVPPVRRLEWTTVKFTKLPAATGDVRMGMPLKKLKAKKVEEQRMVPAPHLGLHGFLTQKLCWPRVQREFG